MTEFGDESAAGQTRQQRSEEQEKGDEIQAIVDAAASVHLSSEMQRLTQQYRV